MTPGGLRLVAAMLVAAAFGAGSTADFVIDLKKGTITPAS